VDLNTNGCNAGNPKIGSQATQRDPIKEKNVTLTLRRGLVTTRRVRSDFVCVTNRVSWAVGDED